MENGTLLMTQKDRGRLVAPARTSRVRSGKRSIAPRNSICPSSWANRFPGTPTLMVASRITGRAVGPLDFHFYVAHPAAWSRRAAQRGRDYIEN